MSEFRWTLEHLRVAEAALERRRLAVEAGDVVPELYCAEPGCDRACPRCDMQCSVIASCIETTLRGLQAQETAGEPVWELRHDGSAYAATAGRA